MKSTKTRVWQAIAVLFLLVNVGGALYAIARGEPLHAVLHVALIIGTWFALKSMAARPGDPLSAVPPSGGSKEPLGAGIEYLQQSVDALALEVERIGESQRFNEKLRAERGENKPPDGDRA